MHEAGSLEHNTGSHGSLHIWVRSPLADKIRATESKFSQLSGTENIVLFNSVFMCACAYMHLYVYTCVICQLGQCVTIAVTQQTVVAVLKCRSCGYSHLACM